MTKRNLRTWKIAKNNVHKLNGVEKPENWKWERINGVFYPAEEIIIEDTSEADAVYAEMYEALDPDASDAEIEALGFEIKNKNEVGNHEVVDYRENCGHLV